MFDFDIIDTKTVLGESGFYLHKSNEIVFLDLLDPTLFIYSLENNITFNDLVTLVLYSVKIFSILPTAVKAFFACMI